MSAETIAWKDFLDAIKSRVTGRDWERHEKKLEDQREVIAKELKVDVDEIQGGQFMDYLKTHPSSMGKIWLDFWNQSGLIEVA